MPERVGVKRIFRDLLLLFAFVAIVIALARPQRLGGKAGDEDSRGIEAMICVDVSNSMLCPDLSPSRIDFTKRMLQTLLSDMKHDRVGIIIFAAKAYVHLPMTTDIKTAQEFVADINVNMLSAQGTAIGDAIQLAKGSFSSSKGIGRTIILLTDGENHEGDALSSASDARDAGIKVQVVGVGTKEGGPIPIDGNYLRDEAGQVVTTHFNPEMCRDIAESGGGAFITSTNYNQVVSSLKTQLEHLPKGNTGNYGASNYIEYYEVVAWLAFILLLWECFVSERKNKLFSKKLFERDGTI